MSQKYCACHAKRLSTRCRTRLNVTKCHVCHAKRSNQTSETSKKDHLCKTSHRHGHTVLTRTVALANATSSEHTLNPQTPRVKRKPLLRIRENTTRWMVHSSGFSSAFLEYFTSDLHIHPASRGVAAHTAGLFRSVRGAKGGFSPVGAPQAKNFHFPPPWGLPKLGNFHFSPRGGSPS